MKLFLAAAAAATTLLGVASAELDPIVIKGNKFFFKSNGTQFYMKGVAYQAESTSTQTTYNDPLADPEACKRDIPYLQDLQTNTIRVYAVDPKADHTECMKLLDDAGIYVVSDLSEPRISINRDDPMWDATIYDRYTAVIDSLAGYSNIIGFFAGNEVSNQANNTAASAYVKAAARDMKSYIKAKGYRSIPVGYAANDDADIRVNMAHYFNCHNQEESIDFWGYNIYSWCGDSSFEKSGYATRTKEYSTYSIPVFFAEYGCNIVQPRKFTEVKALYGDQMTDVWSGGIVYMYKQEENDYGLVSIDGSNVTKIPDYDYLKSQISAVSPKIHQMADYTPANTKLQDCPTVNDTWRASPTLPPTPNKDLCECMVKALECVQNDVATKKYASLFSYICGGGTTDCSGINGNGTTGVYGAYSMCSAEQRLSWAMNAYYIAQGKSSDSCNFSGSATTQTPSTSSGTCSKLIKEAGGVKGSTSTSTSSSSKSSTAKNSGAGTTIPSFQLGAIKIGFAVLAAILGGAALVLV